MTKKHFEAFAREISSSSGNYTTKLFAAVIFCRVAEQDNPRFDRERFLKACGLE